MISQYMVPFTDFLSSFILIFLALDHFVTGFIGVFLPHKSETIVAKMFGVEIVDKEFYRIIVRPWGALGIFASMVGILPIINPQAFLPISYMLIVLLLLRIYYRIEVMKKTSTVLNLSMKRNFFHIGLIILCILASLEKIFII